MIKVRGLVSLCLLLLMPLLAACNVGQNGGDALAFIRGGALWRLQPDGSGLYQIAPATVIGFAWSPDHHILVGRFAATNQVPPPATTYPNAVSDTYAALGTVSIDGGNIIPITPPAPIPSRSDAWWDANSNRLFYREHTAHGVQWYLSQSDQPNGIARKLIATSAISVAAPNGEAMPTSAPDGSQLAWVADNGDLLLSAPAGTPHAVQHGALAQLPNGVPARALWQPHHAAILYALVMPSSASVTLMLTDLMGHAHAIAQAGIDNYAWSPDGQHILVHTPGQWTIYTPDGASVMMWNDNDLLPLAWWSPDGRAVAVWSSQTLTLVTLSKKTVQPLVNFTDAASQVRSLPTSALVPGLSVTGSPWSGDSQHIALVAPGGTWHDGTALATRSKPGTGLYIINSAAVAKAPALVDWGEHQALSWSTPDPNTQLLVP